MKGDLGGSSLPNPFEKRYIPAKGEINVSMGLYRDGSDPFFCAKLSEISPSADRLGFYWQSIEYSLGLIFMRTFVAINSSIGFQPATLPPKPHRIFRRDRSYLKM